MGCFGDEDEVKTDYLQKDQNKAPGKESF